MESTATLRRIVGQYTRFDALVAGDEGEWAVERLERGWIDTAMLVTPILALYAAIYHFGDRQAPTTFGGKAGRIVVFLGLFVLVFSVGFWKVSVGGPRSGVRTRFSWNGSLVPFAIIVVTTDLSTIGLIVAFAISLLDGPGIVLTASLWAVAILAVIFLFVSPAAGRAFERLILTTYTFIYLLIMSVWLERLTRAFRQFTRSFGQGAGWLMVIAHLVLQHCWRRERPGDPVGEQIV